MKYAELAGRVPGWHDYASSYIWPDQGPEGRPRSWNTCEASTGLVISEVYGLGEWPEPERAFGRLTHDDPRYEPLPGHFWPEIPVEDRSEPVIVDLTIGQTRRSEPWVMGTAAELTAMGLHYVSHSRMPAANLACW